MIRVDKLLGLMAEKGLTKKDVALVLGITPKTVTAKMNKGVFGSDEIEVLIDLLEIKNPADIFFAQNVTF